jgi:hypothetical protein
LHIAASRDGRAAHASGLRDLRNALPSGDYWPVGQFTTMCPLDPEIRSPMPPNLQKAGIILKPAKSLKPPRLPAGLIRDAVQVEGLPPKRPRGRSAGRQSGQNGHAPPPGWRKWRSLHAVQLAVGNAERTTEQSGKKGPNPAPAGRSGFGQSSEKLHR